MATYAFLVQHIFLDKQCINSIAKDNASQWDGKRSRKWKERKEKSMLYIGYGCQKLVIPGLGYIMHIKAYH